MPRNLDKAPSPTMARYVEFASLVRLPLCTPVRIPISGNPMFAAQEFVKPLKMTLIAETQMQGSKRQVVSRISIEGLQLREPFLGLIADPPAVKRSRVRFAFIEYHPPLTRVRRRELLWAGPCRSTWDVQIPSPRRAGAKQGCL